MTIGEAIRLIRKRASETQQHMADRLGITNVHLSYLETGKKRTSGVIQDRIRIAYGYEPALLASLCNDKGNLARHRALLSGHDYERMTTVSGVGTGGDVAEMLLPLVLSASDPAAVMERLIEMIEEWVASHETAAV